MKRIFFLTLLVLTVFSSFAQKGKPVKKNQPVKKTVKTAPVIKKPVPGTRIKITTDSGVIIVRLYDKTPKHRDNFIKLVNDHLFDSLLFHRVISGFMIQGGDPSSKNAPAGNMLGEGDLGYTIPAEFDSTLFHKKGALAAARQGDDVNPNKESSACQFYLVQGRKYTAEEISMMESQMGRKFSAEAKKIYTTTGGTPFLDMNYTVFGEVEKGMNVIDKIASVSKDMYDRPVGDIRMKMEIIK